MRDGAPSRPVNQQAGNRMCQGMQEPRTQRWKCHVCLPALPVTAERVRLITWVAATMNRTALLMKEVRLDRLPWSDRLCKGAQTVIVCLTRLRAASVRESCVLKTHANHRWTRPNLRAVEYSMT